MFEVLAVLHNDFLRRKIMVQTRLDTGLPLIMANRVQLQQVILNLCVNAADAMDSVTDRDRVLKVMSEQKSPGVLITVEDSGVGVEPKNIERIFEPFFTTEWACQSAVRLSRSTGGACSPLQLHVRIGNTDFIASR